MGWGTFSKGLFQTPKNNRPFESQPEVIIVERNQAADSKWHHLSNICDPIGSSVLKPSPIIFDGVVKSPIYCVVVIFQILGILYVWPRP